MRSSATASRPSAPPPGWTDPGVPGARRTRDLLCQTVPFFRTVWQVWVSWHRALRVDPPADPSREGDDDHLFLLIPWENLTCCSFLSTKATDFISFWRTSETQPTIQPIDHRRRRDARPVPGDRRVRRGRRVVRHHRRRRRGQHDHDRHGDGRRGPTRVLPQRHPRTGARRRGGGLLRGEPRRHEARPRRPSTPVPRPSRRSSPTRSTSPTSARTRRSTRSPSPTARRSASCRGRRRAAPSW